MSKGIGKPNRKDDIKMTAEEVPYKRYKAIQYDFGGGGLIVDRLSGLTRWDLPRFESLERAWEYAKQLNLTECKEIEKIILG